jgi:hypothetical protein
VKDKTHAPAWLGNFCCANDLNYKQLSVTSVQPDDADDMINQHMGAEELGPEHGKQSQTHDWHEQLGSLLLGCFV